MDLYEELSCLIEALARAQIDEPAADMSPEAVDQRLRLVGQLYRLGQSLKQTQLLGRAEDLQLARQQKLAPTLRSAGAADYNCDQ